MTVTLDTIHVAAADLISKTGWTQNTERDDDGRVCLTGALRHCQPQPGDSQLARGVYRTLGHGEGWNDDDGRTATEVVTYLREHPVTDGLLAQTYGPQWEAVVALVRRAATLTDDEVDAIMAATRSAAWSTARSAARSAAKSAAWETAKSAARRSVWNAANAAARDAVWNAAAAPAVAEVAAGDAACALAARDLLLATPDGTKHYKTLTRPWSSTVGPVHPDDKD